LLLMLLQRRASSDAAKVLPETAAAATWLFTASTTLALIDAKPGYPLQTHFTNRLLFKSRGHRQTHDGRIVVGVLNLQTVNNYLQEFKTSTR
jgi:hypothetical protein